MRVMADPPSHTPRHWRLTCQVNYLPSGAFLAPEPLTPGPTAVSAQPTAVLPLGLFNPCLSAQLLPALVVSCLRQGCSGLIIEEALGYASQDLRVYAGR